MATAGTKRALLLLAPALALLTALAGAAQDSDVLERARELHEQAAQAKAAVQLDRARELAAVAVDELLRAEPAVTGLEVARLLAMLGEIARLTGDLDAALAAHRRAVELRAAVLDPADGDVLEARGNVAVTLTDMGDLRGAREVQEDVLAICEERFADDSEELSSARGNLAVTLYLLGERGEAVEMMRRAVDGAERREVVDEFELSTMRANLATMIAALGDIHGAAELFREVYDARRRLLPPQDPSVARAAAALATARMAVGDVDGARETCERALADVEPVLPADSLVLAEVRAQLVRILRQQGELRRACELQRLVAEATRARLPADHQDVLIARSNLAVMLAELGDYEESARIDAEVLEVRERTRAEDDPSLLVSRANYASTLHQLGRTEEARRVMEDVLARYQDRLGAEHPTVIDLRENLALMLRTLGDLEGALALQERVLEARERTGAGGARGAYVSRGALASTLARAGRAGEALELMTKTVEELEARFDPDHPDVVTARHELAVALAFAGRLEEARAVQEDLLRVLASRPPHHPDRQAVAMDLATTLLAMGEDAAARALLREQVEVCRDSLPADHPILLECRANLVDACARLGRTDEAREGADELARGMLARLRATALLAPRHARAAAAAEWRRLGPVLSVPAVSEAGRALRFDLVETLRDASSGRAARATGPDLELAELRARSLAVRARLQTRVDAFSPQPEAADGAEVPSVVDLVLERDRVEARIRERLSATGALPEPFDREALRRSLAPDELAVGFVEYEALGGRPDSRRLVAQALDARGRIALVELGDAAEVQALVEAWRAAVGQPLAARSPGVGLDAEPGEPDGSEAAAGVALRERVLDPLLARDDVEVARLRVALDGALLLLPLDALPLAGGRVGDRLGVVCAPSLAAPPRRAAEGAPTLVAVGGPDFGASDRPFAPLPGARAEAEAVARRFEESLEGVPVLLADGAATKQAFAARAAGARFLHFATHGWFEAEDVPSLAAGGRGAGVGGRGDVTGLAPMTLCGLALAGANGPPDSLGRRPGRLTAEELAGFDLSRCELAVLSACETNVGVRRAGTGLRSLQAALHAAGTRTAVTSLWKVDDAATRELMERFYAYLWADGLTVGEALWRAKCDLREAGHPTRDWAGWVLSGAAD